MEHLTDINPDVVFLTETWLESDKNSITAEMKDSYLAGLNITEIDLSDHFLIDFAVKCQPHARESKNITYRSLKNVDGEKFRQEVKERLDGLPNTNSVLEKVNGYNKVLSELVDEHAPLKTKRNN